MNKEQILARLEAIEKRVKEIQVETRKDGTDLDKLTSELNELGLEKRQLTLDLQALAIQNAETNTRSFGVGNINVQERNFENMAREELLASPEYRSAFFKALRGVELNEVEKRAYTSASDSAGAVIPTQTSDMIFDKMVKVAPMINEITLLRVAGSLKFGVENVRGDAAAHTENATVTPASDSLAYVTLGGYERIKVIRISKTVQTMAIPAFEAWLTKILAEDIGEKLENDIINGTGSSQPKGIAYATTYTAGSNAVEFTNASTPTYDNVMDMISYLPARYDGKAKFLCNKKFLFGYLAKIKDDQKQPILIKNMTAEVPLAIMGYPVLISDKVADKTMYLGDFTNVVGNLSQDVTIESSTQSGFLNNSIDYRGAALFDCNVTLTDAFIKMSEAAAG